MTWLPADADEPRPGTGGPGDFSPPGSPLIYGALLSVLICLGLLFAGMVISLNPCVLPDWATTDGIAQDCDDGD